VLRLRGFRFPRDLNGRATFNKEPWEKTIKLRRMRIVAGPSRLKHNGVPYAPLSDFGSSKQDSISVFIHSPSFIRLCGVAINNARSLRHVCFVSLCKECPDEVVRDNKRNLTGFITNSSIQIEG
jgi:hypothetical protein